VTGDELYRIGEEWAAIFNRVGLGEVERVITEAGFDECFDDRTNLFLLAQADPTDLALVLSSSSGADDEEDDYVVVRFDGDEWFVDTDPVDWEALEDAAFADEDSDAL
jgi:hypothetical protein